MLNPTGLKSMRTKIIDLAAGALAPTNGIFGVELEIEAENLPSRIEGWVAHEEGSLRGTAIEYVTDGAYTRAELEYALGYLDKAFTSKRTNPSDSYRAGVHIHYNMQQRTLESTIRAIIMYTLVEPIFLKLCGERRDGNLFCLSSYDTGDIHFWLSALFESAQISRDPLRYIGRGKYSSLNTDPIRRFGTLECRSFPTAWEPNAILRYADLLGGILKEHNMHPLEMLSMAKSQNQEFLEKIFGVEKLPLDATSLLGFGIEQTFLLSKIYTDYMGAKLET